MAFWVHGRDSQTGARTDPLFSEAATDEMARAEAAAQGMIVESVERHDEGRRPPPPPAGAGPASVDPRGKLSYEFSPEQCQVIGRLASYMTIVGVVLMLFGAGQIVDGLAGHTGSVARLIQGAFILVIGGLTGYAAAGFRLVVEARSRDVDHLMAALSGLKLIYAIQVWVAGIALAIGAIVLIVLTVLLH
jgi:hypothetical protein